MRKRMVMLVALALVAAVAVWAGGSKEQGKMDPAAKAAKLQAKLGLSDAQTAQVRALIEETHKRWESLEASGKDEAALTAEKKKLKEDYSTRFNAILTAEQRVRYQEMQAEYEREKAAKKH